MNGNYERNTCIHGFGFTAYNLTMNRKWLKIMVFGHTEHEDKELKKKFYFYIFFFLPEKVYENALKILECEIHEPEPFLFQ